MVGKAAQDIIPSLMAMRVVNSFEMVQVAHPNSPFLAFAAGTRNSLCSLSKMDRRLSRPVNESWLA